jgi:Asp-tRNA(Asn)/Glu-tRNA(Gln) amidotransferase A subunit family amidase
VLNQQIFALDRPKTTLTKEYTGLVQKIVAANIEDRQGAISTLGSLQERLSRAPAELNMSTRAALARGAEILAAAGARCETLHLDPRFDGLVDAHETIALAETRAAFLAEYRRAGHLLDDDFKAKVENRAGITAQRLRDAYDLAGECRAAFGRIAAGYDAVLTPAAIGEAPLGLASTGDHVFNRIWTLLHVPCVAVPGFQGPNGLPVGLQLVGPRFKDGRVLAIGDTVSRLFSESASRGAEATTAGAR